MPLDRHPPVFVALHGGLHRHPFSVSWVHLHLLKSALAASDHHLAIVRRLWRPDPAWALASKPVVMNLSRAAASLKMMRPGISGSQPPIPAGGRHLHVGVRPGAVVTKHLQPLPALSTSGLLFTGEDGITLGSCHLPSGARIPDHTGGEGLAHLLNVVALLSSGASPAQPTSSRTARI